ncbi:MAG: lamin tail domain-containing protein [Fibrobacterales bacterium]
MMKKIITLILYLSCAQTFAESNLYISEIYPAPLADQPEWFELTNTSQHSIPLASLTLLPSPQKGRAPYSLVEPNSKKNINAMEQCIITQDSLTFKEVYGTLRLCIIQPPKWYTLSNSGGSFSISTPSELIIDSITWNASQVSSGTALTRHSPLSDDWNSTPHFENGTPGALISSDTLSNSFFLHNRSCKIHSPEKCITGTLTLKYGDHFRWQVFDLSGYRVMEANTDQSGTTQLQWNGEHSHGQLCHPGLYLLTSQFNDDLLTKTTIVLQP